MRDLEELNDLLVVKLELYHCRLHLLTARDRELRLLLHQRPNTKQPLLGIGLHKLELLQSGVHLLAVRLQVALIERHHNRIQRRTHNLAGRLASLGRC